MKQKRAAALLLAAALAAGLLSGCVDGTKAVSYTHLDVYKRQDYRLPVSALLSTPAL